MVKQSLVLLLAGLSFWTASAVLAETDVPEIVVSSQVDKVQLTMDQPLVFSVTIAGSIRKTPKVEIATLEGFRVVSTGQSQRTQIRNGKTQMAVTLEYLLAPIEPGKHTLGPVAVVVEKKRYETNPIEVEVLPVEQRPPKEQKPRIHGGTVL